MEMADAMVSSGMAAVGYEYISILAHINLSSFLISIWMIVGLLKPEHQMVNYNLIQFVFHQESKH